MVDQARRQELVERLRDRPHVPTRGEVLYSKYGAEDTTTTRIRGTVISTDGDYVEVKRADCVSLIPADSVVRVDLYDSADAEVN